MTGVCSVVYVCVWCGHINSRDTHLYLEVPNAAFDTKKPTVAKEVTCSCEVNYVPFTLFLVC
jgi:hypothetical protein